MKPSSYDFDPDTKINWKVFSLIAPFLVEHRARIGFAMMCLVASKGASVSAPFILKHIIDDLSVEGISDLTLVPFSLIIAYGFSRFSMILLGEIRDAIFGARPPS